VRATEQVYSGRYPMTAHGTSAICNEPQSTSELESKPESQAGPIAHRLLVQACDAAASSAT
jgi:hypothetical protein